MLRTMWISAPSRPLLPWLSIILLALSATAALASLPDPDDPFVNDYAGVLESEQRDEIRQVLHQLRRGHGVEAVVVTVPSVAAWDRNAGSIEALANRLFNTWGIGDAQRNDGVLVLMSIGDRQVRIEVGKSYGRAVDAACQRIIDRQMVPEFRRGDFAAGLVTGAKALGDLLTPAEAPVGLFDRSTNSPPSRLAQPPAASPTRSSDNHWGQLGVFGVVSLAFLGLLFAGIFTWRRHRPRMCDQCSARMRLLEPGQTDDHLSQGQLAERTAGTANYRVWSCAAEHISVERLGRLFERLEYCPQCGFETAWKRRETLLRPNYSRAGKASVTRGCHHCDYHFEEFIELPRRYRSTASSGGLGGFGAGSSSGGSFGGGSSGGSFGGGSSSGGGASGRW